MDARIWRAAREGDLAEVERLVGQTPGLLDARDRVFGMTPLMYAIGGSHVGVVRWLLDNAAAINKPDVVCCTALYYASYHGLLSVVKLLLERGADPTIASRGGSTFLMIASSGGHLEVVRSLLSQVSARTTINKRDGKGKTGGGPATTAVGVS
jgi:ankyrin repeat protein